MSSGFFSQRFLYIYFCALVWVYLQHKFQEMNLQKQKERPAEVLTDQVCYFELCATWVNRRQTTMKEAETGKSRKERDGRDRADFKAQLSNSQPLSCLLMQAFMSTNVYSMHSVSSCFSVLHVCMCFCSLP